MDGGELVLPGGVTVALAQGVDLLGLSAPMLRDMAAHGHVRDRWARSGDDLHGAPRGLPGAPRAAVGQALAANPSKVSFSRGGVACARLSGHPASSRRLAARHPGSTSFGRG